MPSTSCTCGSVWRTKFFGEPPPSITTPDLPPERFAASTIAAVSFTSRDTSILSLQPSIASAATFMPIERSEEHTSELQSRRDLVCRLLLEKNKDTTTTFANGSTVIPMDNDVITNWYCP